MDEDVVGFLMKEHLVNNDQDSHCDSFMAKAMGKDGLSLVSRLPGYAAYLDNELHSYIEVLHLLYILFDTLQKLLPSAGEVQLRKTFTAKLNDLLDLNKNLWYNRTFIAAFGYILPIHVHPS